MFLTKQTLFKKRHFIILKSFPWVNYCGSCLPFPKDKLLNVNVGIFTSNVLNNAPVVGCAVQWFATIWLELHQILCTCGIIESAV